MWSVCAGNQRGLKKDTKYKIMLTLIKLTWMIWPNLCKIVCVYKTIHGERSRKEYSLNINDVFKDWIL